MRAECMNGVSMAIGDYGWIECTGENQKHSGWFLRVRVDGKVMYVNKQDNTFMVPDTYFTNANNKDYILHCSVSAIDSMNFDFNKTSKEDIIKESLIKSLEKKIYYLEVGIENDNKMLQRKKDELEKLKLEIDDVSKGKKYHYVYGIHDLNVVKKYVWENTNNLDIKIGDIVEVQTSLGSARILVTKIDDSFINRNHKKVIRKIDIRK